MKHLQIILAAVFLLSSGSAFAHKPSDSYMQVKASDAAVELRWDIALRDLELVIGLDLDEDGAITWGELLDRQKEVIAYASDSLAVKSATVDCSNEFRDLLVVDHSDGTYASLQFAIDCPIVPLEELTFNYSLFFDFDAQHRGLMTINLQNKQFTDIFTVEKRQVRFEASAPEPNNLAIFFSEGVHHIFAGFDHMLFIIALLLPAVYVLRRWHWEANPSLKNVIWSTVEVVTAFTIAHSITLALTTFDLIPIPSSRVAHGAVAATIIFTAFNNLFPVLNEKRWMMGFGFGLIHGMGFASVLTDLGMSGGQLGMALLGFNVGVEVAQVAIILAIVPVSFLMREKKLYKTIVLQGGSVATLLLATGWLAEQIANFRFMPF